MIKLMLGVLFNVALPIYILLYLGLGFGLNAYGTNGIYDITGEELIAHTVVSQLEFTHFMIYPKKVRGTNYRDFVNRNKGNASERDFSCLKNKWIKKSLYFQTLDFILDFKKDKNGVLITDYKDKVEPYVVRAEDCIEYEWDGEEPLEKPKKKTSNLKSVDNRKK